MLNRFLLTIDRFSMAVGHAFAWCILILTLGTCYEVFVRYVLNDPIGEVVTVTETYLMPGIVFFTLAALQREDEIRKALARLRSDEDVIALELDPPEKIPTMRAAVKKAIAVHKPGTNMAIRGRTIYLSTGKLPGGRRGRRPVDRPAAGGQGHFQHAWRAHHLRLEDPRQLHRPLRRQRLRPSQGPRGGAARQAQHG